MQIENRIFLVTGAGSGLGKAVSEMIVSRGGNAVVLDINAAAGAAVAQKLGSRALPVQVDVTIAEEGKNAIAEAIAAFGRIDGLINCAGVAPAENILGRSGPHQLESFKTTVSINLIGTFNMLRLAAEAIAKNELGDGGERGVIVNTASIAAFDGQSGQAAYAASKGGIVSMTLPVARELARFGIRVVAIAPGIFETPMMSAMPLDVQTSLAALVPFPQRLGRPAEYAELVCHILENQMLNGEVIRLDGALRMPSK